MIFTHLIREVPHVIDIQALLSLSGDRIGNGGDRSIQARRCIEIHAVHLSPLATTEISLSMRQFRDAATGLPDRLFTDIFLFRAEDKFPGGEIQKLEIMLNWLHNEKIRLMIVTLLCTDIYNPETEKL